MMDEGRKSWVRVQMVSLAVIALGAWIVVAAKWGPLWENIAFAVFGIVAIAALLVRCEFCGAKGYRRTARKKESPGPFFFFPPSTCPDCGAERYWPANWLISLREKDDWRQKFKEKSWTGLKIKFLSGLASACFVGVVFTVEISTKNILLNIGLFMILLMLFVKCERCNCRGIKKTDKKFEFLQPLFFFPPAVCPKCGLERIMLRELFSNKSRSTDL